MYPSQKRSVGQSDVRRRITGLWSNDTHPPKRSLTKELGWHTHRQRRDVRDDLERLGDGSVDVLDVVLAVNIILSGGSSSPDFTQLE